MRKEPVHRGEKLGPERRLEAFDERCDALEPCLGLGVRGEKLVSGLRGTGHQLKLLVWSITTVGIAEEEVPLDRGEHVAKVLRVRAVHGLGVLQLQGLAGLPSDA